MTDLQFVPPESIFSVAASWSGPAVSAVRNVGELASPYFLLEVWSRREEVDIDPGHT